MRVLKSIFFTILFNSYFGSAIAAYTHQVSGFVEDVSPGSAVQSQVCAFNSTVNTAGLCTFSFTHYISDGGITGNAIANAAIDAQGIHLFDEDMITRLPGFNPGYIISTHSQVDASWQDRLHAGNYSVPTFGYVNIGLTSEGTSTISGGSSVLGNAATFVANLLIGGGSATNPCHLGGAGSCTARQLVDLSVPFTIDVNATAFTQGTILPNPDGTCCITSGGGGTVRFFDTAFISGVSFTDLNGAPLNIAYTTDSGFQYGVSPVPEPETYSLLVAGLLLIARCTKRKRLNRV